MFISNYYLWAYWGYLSLLQRLFCLILSLVSVYTIYSAVLIIVRARSVVESTLGADQFGPVRRSSVMLQMHSANLRQILTFAFYLFGLVFFLSLPFAFNVEGASIIPVGTLILRNLASDFAFAANIFLVFLILHSVQWFTAHRVNTLQIALQGSRLKVIQGNKSDPASTPV